MFTGGSCNAGDAGCQCQSNGACNAGTCKAMSAAGSSSFCVYQPPPMTHAALQSAASSVTLSLVVIGTLLALLV